MLNISLSDWQNPTLCTTQQCAAIFCVVSESSTHQYIRYFTIVNSQRKKKNKTSRSLPIGKKILEWSKRKDAKKKTNSEKTTDKKKSHR